MRVEVFNTCAIATVVALVGCATKQQIPLNCLPEEVVVYVDGELLEGSPSALDLRSDRPHTLFFKGPGLVPELIVLSSEEVDGKATLSPSEVCVKPRYVRVGRELEMEIDPEVSSEPLIGAAEPESTIDVEPRPAFSPNAP